MLNNLTQRERLFVLVGGLALLAVLVYLTVIEPYRQMLDHLDRQISAGRQQVADALVLKQELLQLQTELGRARNQGGARKDFALIPFVENLAIRIASKENLVNMRPQPPATVEDLTEEAVNIKLEKLSLEQLVRMLHAIDSADAYLQVKNLQLKRRFEDVSLLDATMTIATYRSVN